MGLKRRSRLKDGDRVKVVKVPKGIKRWLGRVGLVTGVRGPGRMWHVGFKGMGYDFFRHELKLVKARGR